MTQPNDPVQKGEQSYQEWREQLRVDPNYRAVYDAEAAKSELWLQLVEARIASGLTQAKMARMLGISEEDVARLEDDGFDEAPLGTLQRYVAALGEGYALEVTVRTPS